MTTVRPAVVADAPAVTRLSEQLGYATPEADVADRLQRLARDETQCVRVACDPAGGVIGWLHAADQIVLEAGSRCEILGLVVNESTRGTGAGRALLAEAEAWAVSRSLTVISLRCNVTRTASHAFYRHMGYAAAKTQTAFRKRLSGAGDGPFA